MTQDVQPTGTSCSRELRSTTSHVKPTVAFYEGPYIHIYMCMYIYTYISMYVFVSVYVYIYIHSPSIRSFDHGSDGFGS